MDLIFKNGAVVTPQGIAKADVAVKDGKIAALGQNLDLKAKEIKDVSGRLVLPGALDVHTHMAMPFGGTVSADSYLAGTRAAACGGVTTIFDYPVQHKGETICGLVESKKKILEKEACVDYAMHCCITDLNGGEILQEMEKAVEQGITSFKCFLVYKKEGMMVDDGMLVRLMLRAKELGAMINVHAENPDLIDLYTEQFLAEGKTSAWYHYMSRPEFVEAEADKRTVHWASHLHTPVYLVHMADKEGLEACIKAKEEGHEIYVETCPQYLEFTCDVYKREDGRNFVCSPPMKGEESKRALWTALKSGFIDTVATDHCPFQSYEKDWGKDDFSKIPNGCAGVENLYPYMLDAANRGEISYERAVEVCAANPAKIFGCVTKGTIAPGKDADIVIYDPRKDFTVSVSNMHSDYDHTIWEGKKFHGYPVQTYLRGQLIYDNGVFTGKPGMGQYIKRVPKNARKQG
ncbi:MAG TPA: dihydropyrimidinase [Candidatus Eubacterium avistercoris]|uniref:Dihydropyrimidinase n=1 Tax=Candidatus Eubacterium avistercoris TaxID=2838567 RepID=A0A9D2D4J5_9FIRM|nr:dihydropyrimidinase [Candidatus Eubacterium avistercoris]